MNLQYIIISQSYEKIFILKYYIVVTNGLFFGEKDVSKLLNYFSVGNGYTSIVSEDI